MKGSTEGFQEHQGSQGVPPLDYSKTVVRNSQAWPHELKGIGV